MSETISETLAVSNKIVCSECQIIISEDNGYQSSSKDNNDQTMFLDNFELTEFEIIKMMHCCLGCNKIYCHNCKKPESQLCYYCK